MEQKGTWCVPCHPLNTPLGCSSPVAQEPSQNFIRSVLTADQLLCANKRAETVEHYRACRRYKVTLIIQELLKVNKMLKSVACQLTRWPTAVLQMNDKVAS